MTSALDIRQEAAAFLKRRRLIMDTLLKLRSCLYLILYVESIRGIGISVSEFEVKPLQMILWGRASVGSNV
jgi:hypothetical protein